MNLRYCVVFILLITFQNNLAQKLSARVVDENQEPLVGATVYFDGTTRGVITNIEGIFDIEKPDDITEPVLVITYLGYEAMVETNIQNLKKVYKLKPKAENLDIVNLFASPFTREEMIEVFKENFLGSGKAARQCEIINIDNVIVYYVVKENRLYATSANPIIVQNDYLGYKLKFDLLGFYVQFSTKSLEHIYQKQTSYAGFSYFEDINPRRVKRREKVYRRSLSRFFKFLIEKNLDKTKFEVGYKRFITSADKVFEMKPLENNLYQVRLKANAITTFNDRYIPSKITLKYKDDLTTLKFIKPYCRVGRNGNIIDIENVLLIGKLSESKVAKMLPINFTDARE